MNRLSGKADSGAGAARIAACAIVLAALAGQAKVGPAAGSSEVPGTIA